MKRKTILKLFFAVVAGSVATQPTSVLACAACYGQSDSPLASGVTWGILSLLAVVAAVVGSIVTFFVYIHKKSAAAVVSPNPVTDYQVPATDCQSPVTNH